MPSQIFVATGDDVVRLTLDGATATDPRTVLPGVGARCVAVDPRDPLRVYVGTFDRGLFVSDDGGARWRTPDSGLDATRVLSLAVSPSDAPAGVSVAYAGTEPSNLYRSEDAGHSWQALPALRELPSEPRWSFPPRPWTHHVSTISLHATDPGQLVVGIELGGVMRSFDRGASWIDHNRQAHSDAHQLLTHPIAPERVYEAAGQGVALSEDRGDSWRRYERGLDRSYAWAVAVDPADPDLWYVSVSRSPLAAHGVGNGQARLVRTRDDHGGRWTAIDTWGDEPELRRMPYALATFPDRPGRLLAALRGGTLLLTDDAGESWAQLGVELRDVVGLAVSAG